jgi:hypothetical protein
MPDDVDARHRDRIALGLDQAGGLRDRLEQLCPVPVVGHFRPGRHGQRQLAQRLARLDTLKPLGGQFRWYDNFRIDRPRM